MAEVSKDEMTVLEAFASNVLGGPTDDCLLVEELQPALASLKDKGLVYRVWTLSPEGYRALGIDPERD